MPKVTLKDHNYEALMTTNLSEDGLYIVLTVKEGKDMDDALVLRVTPAPEWEEHDLDVEIAQHRVTTKLALL